MKYFCLIEVLRDGPTEIFVLCFSHGWTEVVVFLGALAKLRKVTIKFVMSVCLSVLLKQLRSHCTDFHEILYLSIFRKHVGEIPSSLKYDDDKGYLT